MKHKRENETRESKRNLNYTSGKEAQKETIRLIMLWATLIY
jgi:hypothetical protein